MDISGVFISKLNQIGNFMLIKNKKKKKQNKS